MYGMALKNKRKKGEEERIWLRLDFIAGSRPLICCDCMRAFLPLGYSSIGVTLSRAAVSLFDLPLTTFMQWARNHDSGRQVIFLWQGICAAKECGQDTSQRIYLEPTSCMGSIVPRI